MINHKKLIVAISSAKDGNMKSDAVNDPLVYSNRQKFLEKNGIDPQKTTLLLLTYDRKNYTDYITIDEHSLGSGIVREPKFFADAIVVTKPNHAILLPLADCIGAIIFDPTNSTLMVSHLGRHNLIDDGGTKSIEYLINEHHCDPANLLVEFSPSAGKANYPLFYFGGQSLAEVASQQMILAGVDKNKINLSHIDTTTDKNYFSHSQFLTGKRHEDSRFAIVAMIKT